MRRIREFGSGSLSTGVTVVLGVAVLLVGLAGCGGGGSDDGGLGGAGGAGSNPDGRYIILDEEEDCDDVEGLRASVILEASGLAYQGELSWTDLETGYEQDRTTVDVDVELSLEGTITCVPFRHFPGQPPEYARLSYDGATMSMTTADGLLSESGSAVVWLGETDTAGDLTLDVVRALPSGDALGTLDVSPVLDDDYGTLVLVYSPSEATPLGHVSFASETASEVTAAGDASAGVPHGFFPALPD